MFGEAGVKQIEASEGSLLSKSRANKKSERGGQKKKKNSLKLKEGIFSNRIWSYKLWNKLLLVQSKKKFKK